MTWKTSFPAAATAAVVTIDGTDDEVNNVREIKMIHCSYSATPTGGLLTVAVNGVTVWQVSLPTTGPFEFDFTNARIIGMRGKNTVVTLASGAGTVVGKLNVKIGER